MRGLVLLCLLPAALSGMNFGWNGPASTTSGAEPSLVPVCNSGQESCGCCLMQKQINRMEQFFNYSVQELKTQLMNSKTNLNYMRASRSAFSVALNNANTLTCFGPFANDKPIIFKNIFINLGNNYNEQTGIFTAPRAGVYSFSISIYSLAASGKAQASCASLRVNGNEAAPLSERNGKDREDSSTAVAAVQLKAGDQVVASLLQGCDICDDVNHYSTFTGFLLYATDKA
uniref:Cerebellin 20 n=1 Tax=Oryzias sinensis TaxID=183150 RepID=A0A8C7X8N1_9TELE